MEKIVFSPSQAAAIQNCDNLTRAQDLPSYSVLHAQIEAEKARAQSDEEKRESARQHASAHMESIAEMVRAINCDDERMADLLDDLADMVSAVDDAENDEEKTQAAADLSDWKAENDAELLELQNEAGNYADADHARQDIQEHPLEIATKSGWHAPGENGDDDEFMILLCTGGPAVRIVGELDQYKQPARAWIECQDWFISWQEWRGENFDHDALLQYCQEFYFGE